MRGRDGKGVKIGILTWPLSAKQIFACFLLTTAHLNQARSMSRSSSSSLALDEGMRPMLMTGVSALSKRRTLETSSPAVTVRVRPVKEVSRDCGVEGGCDGAIRLPAT